MTAISEINTGSRFQFGKNWQGFLSVLNDERIALAEASLKKMLSVETLKGRTFLDIGSGSGLFSLAARRLGAKVHSFDYDPQSVACARELKRRYFTDDTLWTIEQGSVLDRDYLNKLGQFDVVYSWGVLHHTGGMWQALENVAGSVGPQGMLFISLYNDQGRWSRGWLSVKRTYNRIPRFGKLPFALLVTAFMESKRLTRHILTLKFKGYVSYITDYQNKDQRGMNWWHDRIDWIGGYPFEVSKPEEIFDFYHRRGFQLLGLKTCGGGLGCNEFVFHKLNLKS
jgi:2-polyprenyl-3-methyl-5-hydroxy-6-metoxy-1,4-benzoquinol methylase